jgi:hypothetical protein
VINPSPDADDDGFGLGLGSRLSLPPEVERAVRRMVDQMRTPLVSGDPRRHHYVPQFYLRRFASGEQIARVRLDEPGRHDIANVSGVAVMRDLYTSVDVEIGETVVVERLLAMLDGLASSAMARLAAAVLFPPPPEERANFGLWLSMLHVRGPNTRRWMEMMTDQTMKMELSLIHDEEAARAYLRGEDGPEPDEASVRELLDLVNDMDSWEVAPHQSNMVRDMLNLGLEASPYFFGRHWAVLKFPEKGLVLTDKPIILYQKPEKRSPWMGVGIGTADELWLPLDRSTALILHSENLLGDRVVHAPVSHSVDDFNQAVVSQAHREIYCHPDDLPRLQRLRFPDPDRPLMSASGVGWMRAQADGVNATPVRVGHHRYRRGQ